MYDEMTDEELAAATLAMMGYGIPQHFPDGPYEKDGSNKRWLIAMATTQFKHRFAAEVIGSLIEDKEKTWAYCDQCIGSRCKVGFYHWPYEDDAKYVSYDNIAARPRAVCEAVLWAVAAEKEAESDA